MYDIVCLCYDIVCQPTTRISYVDIRYPRAPRIQMAVTVTMTVCGTVQGTSRRGSQCLSLRRCCQSVNSTRIFSMKVIGEYWLYDNSISAWQGIPFIPNTWMCTESLRKGLKPDLGLLLDRPTDSSSTALRLQATVQRKVLHRILESLQLYIENLTRQIRALFPKQPTY